jgi:hypothetical protein
MNGPPRKIYYPQIPQINADLELPSRSRKREPLMNE